MGKKYLDTKQNTIEASVLDVWTKSSEEQEAIRNAAEMVVKEKYDQAAIDAKTDAEIPTRPIRLISICGFLPRETYNCQT